MRNCDLEVITAHFWYLSTYQHTHAHTHAHVMRLFLCVLNLLITSFFFS